MKYVIFAYLFCGLVGLGYVGRIAADKGQDWPKTGTDVTVTIIAWPIIVGAEISARDTCKGE